ncbi:unnamed protein product, partial [Rotaria socialis]
MSKQVLDRILREIQQGKYFSIMIDETTDISKLEQVSLVVRYTNDQFKVHEGFMGFARTTEMTGEALFNLLLEWLKKLNLDVKNIVAQSYDGASPMQGEYKGVAARLKQIAPCGIYIHCNGHILNLCLVDVSTRVSSIRNNFGIVSSLYNLIENSAKRHAIFEEIQEEAGLQSLTIKQMSDTRWTCRWDCLKVVLIRYPQIISTLQLIEAPESHLLLHSMESFDFVFHLFIMSEIYLLTNILSKYLQSSQISITQALKQVKMTVDTLKSLRNETEFERFYSKALQMCEENEIDPPKLSKQYSLSYDDLRGEQRLYKTKLTTSSPATLPEIKSFILDNHLNVGLPVMNKLFKILWTIPVNTCECERSFSTLRRIKTYLRSTTGEDRLSGLALLNIEREAEIDYDEIIKGICICKEHQKNSILVTWIKCVYD